MKEELIKAELRYRREDGSTYMRVIEGEEAAMWYKINIKAAIAAHLSGVNRDWQNGTWKIYELSRPTAGLPTIKEMSGSIDFGGRKET